MCEILSKIFWLATFFWVGYFVPTQDGRQQSPALYLNKVVSHDERATASSVVDWHYIWGEPINNESTNVNNESTNVNNESTNVNNESTNVNNGSTDINNKNLEANLGDKQYLVYRNKPGFREGSVMGYSQDINGEFRHFLTTGRTIRL